MTEVSTPMSRMLDHILDKADKPGEAAVVIQFKSPVPPIEGALRKHPEVDGIYELLAIAQKGPNTQPFAISNYFMADEVSRVMAVKEDTLPAIVSPPSGGLIIPNG